MQEFQESFFQSTSEDTNIKEDWELFKSALMTSADRNIPSKMVSGHSKLPWLSAQLRRLIQRRNRIHTKYKKTSNNRLNMLWHKLRRKVTHSLRSESNQHLNKVIGDIQTNPKPFWNYIRSQRKDNQDMPPLKTPAGTTVDSDPEKAEALNAQFQNNWSHGDLNSVPFLQKTTLGIKNIVVTTNGIIRLLTCNDLKPSKSAGLDKIHPQVLKETLAQVAL